MAAPNLSDYQYQFKDTGFLLNGPSTLPFVDVSKVTGLDLPDYDIKEDDVDGQNGSLIVVRFSKHRVITIEGTIYANPATVETTMDVLRGNFLPDDVEWPFYFKLPGVSQRYCKCKAMGLKADQDALRRIGSSSFLITLGAPNPHIRIDNANVTLAVASTNYPVTNSGNDKTYPTITISGGTMTSITLTNQSTGESLTVTRSFITSDQVVVDMRNGIVYVNGIQNSAVATGTFWGIGAGQTNNIRFTWAGTTVASSVVVSSYSGWM